MSGPQTFSQCACVMLHVWHCNARSLLCFTAQLLLHRAIQQLGTNGTFNFRRPQTSREPEHLRTGNRGMQSTRVQ